MPSKDLFIRFARSMRDGVCRCTAGEGKILFANRAFSNLLGFGPNPHALAGRLLHEVCRGLGERGAPGDPLGRERGVHGRAYRLVTLGGEERRVIIDSFVAGDPKGRARIATLIVRDATGRRGEDQGEGGREASSKRRLEDLARRSAAALRDTEAKYQALIEQIPAITYVAALDESSTTLFVSPQIELTGYSPDDYRADPDLWRKRIHPEDRERVLREVLRKRSPDRSIVVEYRMIARDGRVIWIRDEGRVVRSATGGPLFLQGVMFDITERKRLDEELERHRAHLEELVSSRTIVLEDTNERLRASEAKYRDLVEHANCMIVQTDRTGRITFFNECAERFFGFAKEEIHGKRAVGAIAPRTGEVITRRRKLVAAIARDPDANPEAEVENVTRDGRRVWVAWKNRGIRDARGRLVGFLSVGTDVTERRRMWEMTLRFSALKEGLLGSMPLREKLSLITQGAVEILGADFARIWMTGPGDLCGKGCVHAASRPGPHACRDRSLCLHLVASSGRYTGLAGGHRRVPMGAYKIGRVASGEDPGFITNDAAHDPRVHDHAWARSLGLASFAGYRLLSDKGQPIGVFALFAKKAIAPEEAALLADMANAASQVILSGRVEEALKASRAQYRTTIDSLDEAIHVVDGELRILLANRACARWARRLGWRGEIEGRTVFEVFPFLPHSVRNEYRRVARTGRTVVTQERNVIGGRELITETRKLRVFGGGEAVRVITVIADVTARRKAEEAIRESEEKYRAIFEQAPDSLLLIDVETGRFIAFNDRAHRALGYTRKEFRELTIADIDAAESADEVARHIRKIVRDGSDVFETRQRTKGGRFLDVIISTRSIAIGGKRFLQAVWMDITGRKRAEKEIRESRERFRAFMDHSPSIAWAKDEEGRHVYINRAYEKRFGVRLKERRGRTDAELWPARIAAEFRRNDLKVLRSGRPLDVVEETTDAAGGVSYWWNFKFPYRDASGRRYVGGIGFDLTERKRMEDAVRASEEKYRALMEDASDAIFLAESDGTLVDANRAALKMTGYSKKELLGQRYARLHPPAERQRVAAAFEQIRRGGGGGIGDTLVVRRDGALVPVDITGSLIRYGGKEVMQGIMRDISERKRLEAMKDNLVRDVSHELKAPIAMMEMAHAMEGDALDAGDLGEMRRAREIVSRNLAVLGRDIGNIVGMCALRGRTMAPKPAPVSIGEIAGEIAGEMRDRAAERKVALSVRIGKGADRITADRRMVRTLLYNLMDNAVKFTQHGSVSLSSSRAGGWLTIRVRDTGTGIAAKDAEAVFTKFFKKNPATQGTGLGLPICREIAALHGGTVRLLSAGKGMGTTAVVRLPVRRSRRRGAGRGAG